MHLSQNGLKIVSDIGLCETMTLSNFNMVVNGGLSLKYVEKGDCGVKQMNINLRL